MDGGQNWTSGAATVVEGVVFRVGERQNVMEGEKIGDLFSKIGFQEFDEKEF